MPLVSVVLISLLMPLRFAVAATVGPADVSTVRLEVEARPDCTSRNEIIAAVAARSSRIRFVDDAAYTARAVVATPRSGSVVADMVVAATGENPASRRVAAWSCAEVTDAIALIIAVTLDPTAVHKASTGIGPAARSSLNASTAAGSSESPGGAAPPKPSAESVVKPPEQSTISPKPAATVIEPSAAQAGESVLAGPPRFVLYAMGQTVFGPAPAVMPGLALYALTALDRQSILSPAAAVGAIHSWRSELSERGGKASFALDVASVDLCPMTLRTSVLAGFLCASAMVGWTSSSGSDTQAPKSRTRPFVAVGGSLVLSVALGTRFSLAARLGTDATAIRDSYYFGASTFHRAALFTTSASVGLGMRLP
jgi:hypothetical protein